MSNWSLTDNSDQRAINQYTITYRLCTSYVGLDHLDWSKIDLDLEVEEIHFEVQSGAHFRPVIPKSHLEFLQETIP